MIYKIFSVRDSKANAFLQPFFMNNQGTAIRAITDCANDPNHAFFKHSNDYDLFQIGEFNEDDGKVIPLDSPLHVVSIFQLIEVN